MGPPDRRDAGCARGGPDLSASTPPSLAVVIPVLDESDNLRFLLEDLRVQRMPPDEVIVVDAGSKDGTQAIVTDLAHTWPVLRLVEHPGATPGTGRNIGIGRSSAQMIATLDAGSRVGPGWLEAMASDVVGYERTVVIGTAVADAQSAFERAAGWFTLTAFKPVAAPGPAPGGFLPAGRNGIFLRRSAWEDAGRYPDALPWGEDKRFIQALRSAGYELRVASDADVRWRPRSSPIALFRQYERYGRGDAMAKVDRQNELITLGMFAVGAALGTKAALGDRRAGAGLVVAATGYLGLFVRAAARDLDSHALAWVPGLRLLIDVAKVSGFLRQLGRESFAALWPGRHLKRR